MGKIVNLKVEMVSLVGSPANQIPFLLLKSSEGNKVNSKAKVEILVKNDEERKVTGVVYEPNVADAHNDWADEEIIRTAAHEFLKNYNLIDVEHNLEPNPTLSVVESYILQDNTIIEGKNVTKGSWVMTVEINDNQIWKQVKKGELNGFSLYGIGRMDDTKIKNRSKGGKMAKKKGKKDKKYYDEDGNLIRFDEDGNPVLVDDDTDTVEDTETDDDSTEGDVPDSSDDKSDDGGVEVVGDSGSDGDTGDDGGVGVSKAIFKRLKKLEKQNLEMKKNILMKNKDLSDNTGGYDRVLVKEAEQFVKDYSFGGQTTLTVPAKWSKEIIRDVKSKSVFLSMADDIPLKNATTFKYPIDDDTTFTVERLAEYDGGVKSTSKLSVKEISQGLIQTSTSVTDEMRLMTPYKLMSFIKEKLVDGIVEYIDDKAINGTDEIVGFTTNAGVLTFEQTADGVITYDDLIDIEMKLDKKYRKEASYYVSSAAYSILRKLKDSNGTPLWVVSMRDGEPSRLNGRPVYEVSELDDSNAVLLFCNMKKFYSFVSLEKSVEIAKERHERERYDDLMGRMYLGGDVTNLKAGVYMKKFGATSSSFKSARTLNNEASIQSALQVQRAEAQAELNKVKAEAEAQAELILSEKKAIEEEKARIQAEKEAIEAEKKALEDLKLKESKTGKK